MIHLDPAAHIHVSSDPERAGFYESLLHDLILVFVSSSRVLLIVNPSIAPLMTGRQLESAPRDVPTTYIPSQPFVEVRSNSWYTCLVKYHFYLVCEHGLSGVFHVSASYGRRWICFLPPPRTPREELKISTCIHKTVEHLILTRGSILATLD